VDGTSIDREIYIDATREVVFEVVSRPEHLRRWWPDEAEFDPIAGSQGRIAFRRGGDDTAVVGFAVVEVEPPERFSFRWTQAVGEPAAPGTSLLVTFELRPMGTGTLLRMSETGFHAMGWTEEVLDATYRDHVAGWDHFLPRLVSYAAGLGVPR
jgi:uncharacterized protein YndB with AHSA1/START domain